MISTNNVLKEMVTPFDLVQVDHLGCTYKGSGHGRWNPESGLEIHAIMELVRGVPPKQVAIGEPVFGDCTYKSMIRLKSGNTHRGSIMLTNPLRANLGLVGNKVLNLRFDHLLSWTADNYPPSTPTGCLIYEDGHQLPLPDVMQTIESVGGQRIGERHESCLKYHRDGYFFEIRNKNDQLHSIRWRLPEKRPEYLQIVRWPLAIARAWQLVKGTTLWPIAWEIRDTRKHISMCIKREKPVALKNWSPLGRFKWCDGDTLLALAQLFAKESKESTIALQLFEQCADAARNRTWQAARFLIGTALEGALRTLYGYPYVRRKADDKFKLNRCLKRLTEDYFDTNWRPVRKKVEEIFGRIRHRSAHPDWLSDVGGALTAEQIALAEHDLAYLSRFYGYLILRIAKVENVRPIFPELDHSVQERLVLGKSKNEKGCSG